MQSGFTLVELSVVIIIGIILSTLAVRTLVLKAEEATAAAVGVYLDTVASAGQRHILTNFQAYSQGTDVPSVAVDLQPTLPELLALGRLVAGFPVVTPNQQTARIDIVRTNCPGPACNVTAFACLTAGYQSRGAVREDMATLAMVAMNGRGGRSHADAPAIVRGSAMNTPNPNGAVNAVVCGSSSVDTGLFDRFVTINDTRDPNFQGGVTISGTNTTGEGLRVNNDIAVFDPATGQVCIRLLRNGQVDINCDGRLNAQEGTFTAPGGIVVRVGRTGTNFAVDTNGRIKADAGLWTALGSLYGDNTLGVRAASAVFTIQTAAGVDAVAVHDQGRLGARTSVATPALGLTDPVAAGQLCSTAAAEVTATQVTAPATTVIRALLGGGFASCVGGQWAPIAQVGNLGAACSPDGSSAVTPAGILMMCSGGQYVSMASRFGSIIFAESYLASDSTAVAKPVCAAGSTSSRIVLTAGNEEQKVQKINRYVQDNGASWNVFLRDGENNVIDGDMVANTYCVY